MLQAIGRGKHHVPGGGVALDEVQLSHAQTIGAPPRYRWEYTPLALQVATTRLRPEDATEIVVAEYAQRIEPVTHGREVVEARVRLPE